MDRSKEIKQQNIKVTKVPKEDLQMEINLSHNRFLKLNNSTFNSFNFFIFLFN